MLWMLTGCDSDDAGPSDGGDGCDAPAVTVVSPEHGAQFDEGDVVPLEATATGVGTLLYTWAVDSDGFTTGATASWEAEAGQHTISVQVDSDCGSTQASALVNVRDLGDLEEGVTTWGADEGIAEANWYGLSVAGDGTVWATGSAGLVHLDPETNEVRVYGAADGLLDDAPYGILAHTDGTLWVGHLGEVSPDTGAVEVDGEQVSVGDDGNLTVLRSISFGETREIAYLLRMREQLYGAGAGEVWMGTNEGLCVYDPGLDGFYEHAHPVEHPHGYTWGVAHSPDGAIWNGDVYSLTRWTYAQDGYVSPSADHENVYIWPVTPREDAIGIQDLDADATSVWVASSEFGVARVDVEAPTDTGASRTVELFADPWPSTANAIRVGVTEDVWIGTETGLHRWDGTELASWAAVDWLPTDVVQQIDVDNGRDAVWLATTGGLVRIVGVPE